MRNFDRRLLVLELATKRSLGVRHFWGHAETGKFYECDGKPNYRRGLAPDDNDGPSFSVADLADLENLGWECVVIHLRYVPWPPGGGRDDL